MQSKYDLKETASKGLSTFSVIISLSGFVLFNGWFLFQYHFMHDFECPYLSSFLPRMSHNPNFDLCTKINCNKNDTLYKIIFNTLLITQFWIQHYIMMSPTFKKTLCTAIPKYLIFERSNFVLASIIHNLGIYLFWQPLTQYSFQLPDSFYFPFLGLSAMGFILWGISVLQIRNNDLFGISNSIKLLQTGEIRYPYRFKLVQTHMYSLCRNPIMVTLYILLGFSSIKFNLGRIILFIEMMAFTYYGVILKEKYIGSLGLNERYEDYKRRVPRFLPLGKWITSDSQIQKKTT